MANTCSTEYIVYGPPQALNVIYNKIWGKLQTQLQCELYEAVEILGGNPDSMCCRGTIVDVECYRECLSFWMSTAWREQSDFRHFLEERFPEITVYWYDEEPGCGWYATNDNSWKYHYVTDIDGNGIEYHETLEEARLYVYDALKRRCSTPEQQAVLAGIQPTIKSIIKTAKALEEMGAIEHSAVITEIAVIED